MDLIVIILLLLILLSVLYLYKRHKTYVLPYSVVVASCARNIESYLPIVLDKFKMIRRLFKTCNIIVYENDSNDNTRNILKQWHQNKIIKLITADNVQGKRTQILAKSRQILYEQSMQYKPDYFIVTDLDDVIVSLSENSIISCFNITTEWAGLGANQTNYYYDLWALRTKDNWLKHDVWECLRICQQKGANCKRYEAPCFPELRTISMHSNIIPVDSCFGGTMIYNTKYLKNCNYGAGIDAHNNEICEHVQFSKTITRNGGKLFINPAFINK